MITWRGLARPIIAEVVEANRGKPEKVVRKALRDAYPWGERDYHPYRVWCDEIRRQLQPPDPPPDRGTTGLPLFDQVGSQDNDEDDKEPWR